MNFSNDSCDLSESTEFLDTNLVFDISTCAVSTMTDEALTQNTKKTDTLAFSTQTPKSLNRSVSTITNPTINKIIQFNPWVASVSTQTQATAKTDCIVQCNLINETSSSNPQTNVLTDNDQENGKPNFNYENYWNRSIKPFQLLLSELENTL